MGHWSQLMKAFPYLSGSLSLRGEGEKGLCQELASFRLLRSRRFRAITIQR